MLKKLLDQLRYPSTYKGLAAALTLVGIKMEPAMTEQFVQAGVAVYAFVSLFFSDADTKPKA